MKLGETGPGVDFDSFLLALISEFNAKRIPVNALQCPRKFTDGSTPAVANLEGTGCNLMKLYDLYTINYKRIVKLDIFLQSPLCCAYYNDFIIRLICQDDILIYINRHKGFVFECLSSKTLCKMLPEATKESMLP